MKETEILITSYIENLDPGGMPEGDAERTEVRVNGSFTWLGGDFSISYCERSDGGEVKSEIIATGGRITVRRSGAIVSEMLFSEKETHRSVYMIPPYSFDTEIYTKKIRNGVRESGGRLDILYKMSIGGQDKNVRMSLVF